MRKTMAEAELKAWLESYSSDTNDIYANYSDEKYEAYAAKYWAPDLNFIRPSGNPMGADGFKGMFSSGMIKDASSVLVSLDSVRLLGMLSCWPAALPPPPGATVVCTYTTHDKFTYDGTVNDDIAKFSAVLEKGLGGWKATHIHRATGQPPK